MKFLDRIESSGALDTMTLQNNYVDSMLNKVKNYLYMLEEFHVFRPSDDGLVPIYDILFEGLEKICDMIENNDVNNDYIANIIDNINLKKGSSSKWGEKRLKTLKESMKECREFLQSISSFYENERDVTAQASSLLMREYTLLERRFLGQKLSVFA